MREIQRSQSFRSPAEIYHAFFGPALFQQWGSVVVNAAEVGPGQDVLDVACGTGILACAAADRVGSGGAVMGLDPNEEMLAVARRKNDTIEWRLGRAEAIPFPDESFDAVVSQFGLMFFEDKSSGLREMMRVLRPGGRLAAAVCDALEHSPGYSACADLLRQLFGEPVATAFRAPFALGDAQRLLSLCADAGIYNARVVRYDGMVRFESVQSLVSTERACAWTLGGLLDDAQFQRLAKESERVFRPFVASDGKLAFAMPVLIVTASKACTELPEF